MGEPQHAARRIALLCATHRGRVFLERLHDLAPEAELIVFSFREDQGEPRYLDDIREATLKRGGRFFEGRKVSSPQFREVWTLELVDLLFAVNWRYRVAKSIYERPRLGSFVFHDSFLPAYRGFSPTVWAMVNGESQTGASLIEMSEVIDGGAIVDQTAVRIGPTETIAEVMDRVTHAYLELLNRNLPLLLSGQAARTPQDEARATYACKRLPDDNRIDWGESTRRIYDLVRAATRPYPGAFTFYRGQRLTVWSAEIPNPAPLHVGRIPGRVVEVRAGGGVVVLTGDGSLVVTRVQLADSQAQPASAVISSLTDTLGA